MKNAFKITSFLFILGLGLFINTSCKKSYASPENDAIDLALADKRFTVFTKLLTDNGLVDGIKTSEPYTIFAPTNEAFSKIDISKLTKNELLKLLNTHIVRNRRLLTNEMKSGVVQSPNVAIYLSKNSSGVFINGSSKVVSSDILASNGVIQVVDQVVVPPTQSVMTIIRNNTNFSELVSWILAAENNMETNLSYSSPTIFGPTIFAPTNAAFERLYKITPKATLLADKKLIYEILRFHMIGGKVFSQDFPNITQPINANNTPITAGTPLANGTDLFANNPIKSQYQLVFDLSSGVKVKGISSGSANVTGVNLLAINGVVHTIDEVLLP
jgi:uncharacterized surface protein with fasciclin (FAS1) repeats